MQLQIGVIVSAKNNQRMLRQIQIILDKNYMISPLLLKEIIEFV